MIQYQWLDRVTAPGGMRAAGIRAGVKTVGPDIAVLFSDRESSSAAVFTQSQFCAPPVSVSRKHAAGGALRAIVANSGCANCCTGEQGIADAVEMAVLTAEALGIPPDRVLVASTGIIGHPLPMDILRAGIPSAVRVLHADGFGDASEAILTTDTHPKAASILLYLDGHPVTITGMVKGSGMVGPRMATVFAFFATDAGIEAAALQDIFARVIDCSINRVTVDGDTSTNDTACILASGAAGIPRIKAGDPAALIFEEGLTLLAQRLARSLARDGEGANHLLTVRVRGARSESDADAIAMTIANSPLVKTAIFGRDPNWGRIAMAAGRAGVEFDQAKVDIRLNGFDMAIDGGRVEFDEKAVQDTLSQDEITIEVDLKQGSAEAVAWTCDFSYDYVKINAEYHT